MIRTANQASQRTDPRPSRKETQYRKARILARLRELGADEFDLLLPESRCLPRLLQQDEQILGVVFGKYARDLFGAPPDTVTHASRGLLLVTDRRVLLVDKKPLFMHFDDIRFEVVSGVRYGQVGFGQSVTLSTRMGDIRFRTFNERSARKFVKATEAMLFERQGEEHDISRK